MIQSVQELKEILRNPKKIVITTHHKPDGDAMGSSLAWSHYLKKKGHHVHLITPSDYPDFLTWLPGNEEVVIFSNETKEKVDQLIKEADIICGLDFSSVSRVQVLRDMIEQSQAYKIMIDHHLDPETFANFAWWDTTAAATAQLVYELINELGDVNLIDKTIGTCIYTGMMTDTSSFRHPSTTKRVHLIAGELIEKGINTAAIHRLIYDNNSQERVKFLGYALAEKLIVIPEYKTAYFAITKEELKKFHSKTGDTEGLVNFALSLKDIVLGAVFIDRVEAIKISFRSIGDFSVNELSKTYFNGGGHKNAAGGISYDSLEKTIEKFVSILPLYKEKINQINKNEF